MQTRLPREINHTTSYRHIHTPPDIVDMEAASFTLCFPVVIFSIRLVAIIVLVTAFNFFFPPVLDNPNTMDKRFVALITTASTSALGSILKSFQNVNKYVSKEIIDKLCVVLLIIFNE